MEHTVDSPRPGEMKCAVLMACARLLMYPDTSGLQPELREVKEGLLNLGFRESSAVITTLDRVLSRDPLELAEEYVSTFDLSEGTTLHLTAHEFGDSRERGPALLQLAQMYRVVGLAPYDDQLSDYLPQLLEMLVVAIDDGADTDLRDELESRVAKACRKIRNQLGDGVYRDVFAVLVETLSTSDADDGQVPLPVPSDEEEGKNMPYPLHYE